MNKDDDDDDDDDDDVHSEWAAHRGGELPKPHPPFPPHCPFFRRAKSSAKRAWSARHVQREKAH